MTPTANAFGLSTQHDSVQQTLCHLSPHLRVKGSFSTQRPVPIPDFAVPSS
jgi:hypothetical protein